MRRVPLAAALAVALLAPLPATRADEGMWLPDSPPRKLLKEKYGFELTSAWLERARKASVRFPSASGGFVSPEGLLVTNHHVGADSLQKLSTRAHNYLRDGYLARTRDRELRCSDMELNVLMDITDVTTQVDSAVKPGMSPAKAAAARRAVLNDIEAEAAKRSGLKPQVVTLYQGGQYHLYLFKKYTDVRLVFAPEQAIASFGGDVDNFEYPRYCLDVCFFRAYEGGKPARTPHFFRWSRAGPKEGDLVFVTGHPGSTNRLDTLAKLRHRRDVTLPYTLNRLRAMEALLAQFSARGPDEARMGAKDLQRVANARKAYAGQYAGLLDPAILARKEKDERTLRDKVDADAGLRKACAGAWEQVAESEKKFAGFEKPYHLLERGDAFDGRLFGIARHLVRLAAELPKPNAERLREYRSSELDSLKLRLFSPAPVHPELERAQLSGSLSFLAENLGAEHPLVAKVLAGRPPAARAAELVNGSKLADVAERKRLFAGGARAVESSKDPLVVLARAVDGEARALRKRFEEEVEEPQRQANARIAKARFKLLGTAVAPDATFTLRLAFGVVKGYEAGGAKLPCTTTFAGAFERAERQRHREPFVLPARWREGKGKLDLSTPLDFVSTADTIGGNSGSPVLNRAGELVGINFDRNRQGLVRNFVYTDAQARHIAVHSRAVLEALRKLYGAESLVKELTGEK
jgi:hypothetical protein